ncbi:MAG TPA: molybdenum cofactor biosynthesis protein MoaE [Rhizomicrobium sp.]|jgi:molybdopterin synthase catalytic subunit|nr:molybdenum cofactor biosynthesis protein MoaE [Rhizomicrobium sp.]
MSTIRVQREDFDTAAEVVALKAADNGIGAVVTFTGIVRGNGVTGLTLEHYPGMTEREIARHVNEASARWPLLGVTVVHRIGSLRPGDNIVLVATASSHREPAFEAAEFLMDYLKTRAPFWKLEEAATGTEWVEARGSDNDAVRRWRED